jgi:hypothetical protein
MVHLSDTIWAIRSRSNSRRGRKRSSPGEKGRRRGLAALDLNGEVDPVVLGNDEVHNGVKLEVAEAMAKRRLWKLPVVATGGDWRLGQVGGVQGPISMKETGRRRSYQEGQGDEASSMAKLGMRGCSGSLANPRWSNCCGRRDLVADELGVLEHKQGRNHVRGVRKIEVKGVGVERNLRACELVCEQPGTGAISEKGEGELGGRGPFIDAERSTIGNRITECKPRRSFRPWFPPPKFLGRRVTQAMMSLVGSACQREEGEAVYRFGKWRDGSWAKTCPGLKCCPTAFLFFWSFFHFSKNYF